MSLPDGEDLPTGRLRAGPNVWDQLGVGGIAAATPGRTVRGYVAVQPRAPPKRPNYQPRGETGRRERPAPSVAGASDTRAGVPQIRDDPGCRSSGGNPTPLAPIAPTVSVYLEFTVEGEAFQLGTVLSPPPEMHIELERIVPTGEMVTPFLWASGEEFEAFEQQVSGHPAVREFRAYDKIGESALYRIVWKKQPRDLLQGIAGSGAIVLEARRNGTWTFRLRFPDHDTLTAFHNTIIEQGIPIHIEQTYTLTGSSDHVNRFGLTPDQREALVLALQRGYFATPREASLDDIAEELDITRQAVSNRIRLGTEKVLRTCLLSSARDWD